jgi:hypothetical protein
MGHPGRAVPVRPLWAGSVRSSHRSAGSVGSGGPVRHERRTHFCGPHRELEAAKRPNDHADDGAYERYAESSGRETLPFHDAGHSEAHGNHTEGKQQDP